MSNTQLGGPADTASTEGLLKETLELNRVLREELEKERKALDEERAQKKQREQKIMQFNEVILRLQHSISSSHEMLKQEHEAEYKRLNEELGTRIQNLTTRLGINLLLLFPRFL